MRRSWEQGKAGGHEPQVTPVFHCMPHISFFAFRLSVVHATTFLSSVFRLITFLLPKLEGVLFKTLGRFLPLHFKNYGIRLNQSLKKLNQQNCLKEKSSKTIKIVMQKTEKITVFHVDKLSLCYLLNLVIHKHDSNNICYPLLQPFHFPSYIFIPSIPYS